jgi:hypothetical protein
MLNGGFNFCLEFFAYLLTIDNSGDCSQSYSGFPGNIGHGRRTAFFSQEPFSSFVS